VTEFPHRFLLSSKSTKITHPGAPLLTAIRAIPIQGADQSSDHVPDPEKSPHSTTATFRLKSPFHLRNQMISSEGVNYLN